MWGVSGRESASGRGSEVEECDRHDDLRNRVVLPPPQHGADAQEEHQSQP